MCVCVGVWAHEYTVQNLDGVLDLQELDLQAVVSYPIWVLGTKPGSSGRAIHVHKRWGMSPACDQMSFNYKALDKRTAFLDYNIVHFLKEFVIYLRTEKNPCGTSNSSTGSHVCYGMQQVVPKTQQRHREEGLVQCAQGQMTAFGRSSNPNLKSILGCYWLMI